MSQDKLHVCSPTDVIVAFSVNLARLVEETVEGCWIGQRARAMQGQSDIGSFYSPPQAGGASGQKEPVKHVETVIDIGLRKKVCVTGFQSSRKQGSHDHRAGKSVAKKVDFDESS